MYNMCQNHSYTHLILFVTLFLVVGLNYETEAELRQKRLSKVGELLAIVIMSAGCLTAVRLAFRKKFSS